MKAGTSLHLFLVISTDQKCSKWMTTKLSASKDNSIDSNSHMTRKASTVAAESIVSPPESLSGLQLLHSLPSTKRRQQRTKRPGNLPMLLWSLSRSRQWGSCQRKVIRWLGVRSQVYMLHSYKICWWVSLFGYTNASASIWPYRKDSDYVKST